MKKLALLSMVFLSLTAVMKLQARTIGKETKNGANTENSRYAKSPADVVSVLTKSSFYDNFSNAQHVFWDKPGMFQEATFTKAGKELTAYFDSDHELVGTTAIKSFTDLPMQGQKEIESRYKDYAVNSVIFFKDNQENETTSDPYNDQLDDSNNYFVELSNQNNKIILQVDPSGQVSFFRKL